MIGVRPKFSRCRTLPITRSGCLKAARALRCSHSPRFAILARLWTSKLRCPTAVIKGVDDAILEVYLKNAKSGPVTG
jgi:hypothetical protein